MSNLETKIAALKEIVEHVTFAAEEAVRAEKTAWSSYQQLREQQDIAREAYISALTAETAARAVFESAGAASQSANLIKSKALDMLDSFTQE